MGIMFSYQTSQSGGSFWYSVNFGIPYLSISIALNILLTLMIIVRLVLYTKNTRTALGFAGIGGLCIAMVTMLVESCALYAMSSLLVLVPWAIGSHIESTFLAVLTQTQVRAFP